MKKNPIDVPQKYKDVWHDKDFESLWMADMIYFCIELQSAVELVNKDKLHLLKKTFTFFGKMYNFTMTLDELHENYSDYSKEDFKELMINMI